MIRTFRNLFILSLLSIVGQMMVYGQGPRVGFVNSAKVLQEFPEAVEANHKLEGMSKQWQGELEKLSKELQQKYEDFQKKEPLMKEDEKRSRREDIVQMEQKATQFRSEKFGTDGELAFATDSLLRPIKQRVMKVIESVAKEEKIQFMFDRNDQILVLLYGDPKFDYTNLVIDRLKRGGRSK